MLEERDKINRLLQENIASSTPAWGIEVERFEMKDFELPEAMQQVRARRAQRPCAQAETFDQRIHV